MKVFVRECRGWRPRPKNKRRGEYKTEKTEA